MPVLINQESVDPVAVSDGVSRQGLIDPDRVGGDFVLLDRLTVDGGASMAIDIAASDLAWFQLLDGAAALDGPTGRYDLTPSHVVFIPPRYAGALTTGEGAVVLFARVPNAARFDPNFSADPPSFRCIDWRDEPVLDSENDARKRIYLVTPTLFGTKAVKGEMIIYPPGTEASNHHHEGAEHFQYVLRGSGIAYLSEAPHPIRAGDTLYNYEMERHYFVNDTNEDFVFVEYFVPAECHTIWAPDALVCAWLPTGKNIDGGQPAREIDAHSSAETTNPDGV